MEEITLDRWTSLFLFACVQGFFLAFLLFLHKRGDQKANKLLSLLIFLFSTTLVYYVAYWTGFAARYSGVNGWVEPLAFLFGPITYLYLRQLEDKKLPPKTWLHFLPYLLNATWMIPFIIRNNFGRVEFLRQHFFRYGSLIDEIQLAFIIAQLMSLTAYGIALFIRLKEDKSKLNSYASPKETGKHAWLKKVFWFYAGFAICAASYWILVWTGLLRLEYDYMISVAMSAFIYMVGYLGFKQPEIFNGYVLTLPAPQTGERKSVQKYVRSNLKEDQAKQYVDRLLEIMKTEKPFLESELKIQQLAEKVGISSHLLSQIINEYLQQTFPDFVNTYRINEARRLLLSPDYENEKILSVAFDSGFQNKATFNALFKKHTGMSPSEFRKHQRQVIAN